jgi:hypothetical protein
MIDMRSGCPAVIQNRSYFGVGSQPFEYSQCGTQNQVVSVILIDNYFIIF